MAYTKSPQFNTYKTEYVAFSELPNYRDNDYDNPRDTQIVNMYWDFNSSNTKPRILKKRPGVRSGGWSLVKNVITDDIRGSYYDATTNTAYWAVGDRVYARIINTGSQRTVTVLNTSSGYVGFSDYLKSDNTRYVVFSDGTDLWLDNYGVGTCARVTDVDLPSPHQPYPVYLDGYIVLIDSATGDIYNSVVDDPTSWVPGDFITAEMSADHAIALARLKNYIVVFGYDSTEMFYNAGIATGSPFQRNDSAYHSIGYISGLTKIGDAVYFVGQQKNGGVGVFMAKDFTVTKISSEMVDRLLQNTDNAGSAIKSDIRTDAPIGHTLSFDGHKFYVVELTTTTLVFDVDNNYWAEWKHGSGSSGMKFQAVWNAYNGHCFVALDGASSTYVMSNISFSDVAPSASNIYCSYITGPLDFGTKNRKVCHRLFLDCSQTQRDVGVASNVSISWSDQDNAPSSFSSTRTVDAYSQAPFINRLGTFRTRTFKILESTANAFWIRGMYLDLNIMQV